MTTQFDPTRDAIASDRRWHDLGVRATSGVVLVLVAIATMRAGGMLFTGIWLVAALATQWEWQRLVGGSMLMARVLVGSIAVVVIAAMARDNSSNIGPVLLVFALCEAALAGEGRRIWAAAGTVYAGVFVIAIIALRFSFPFGVRAIVWLFATVWATDIFAYFGGRLIGGPKLWPRISPSKTWSGTLSGLAAGALFGTIVALRDLPVPTALVPVFLMTLATAAVSQAGDAFESSIKRRFGVKDSSRLIPGHGGMMDRLDGFISAAVFAFLFGASRNLPSIALGLFYWA